LYQSNKDSNNGQLIGEIIGGIFGGAVLVTLIVVWRYRQPLSRRLKVGSEGTPPYDLESFGGESNHHQRRVETIEGGMNIDGGEILGGDLKPPQTHESERVKE
jgi:hypothetical protein